MQHRPLYLNRAYYSIRTCQLCGCTWGTSDKPTDRRVHVINKICPVCIANAPVLVPP